MGPDLPELSDGVVVLRALGLDDVDAHLAGEDEQLARWLDGGLRNRESVEDRIRRSILDWYRGGPVFTFGIRVQTTGELVGTVDLHPDHPDLALGQADISYGLYAHGRGHGYASRAVLLGCTFLRRHAGSRQAVISVDPANTASAAVAQRCGFRRSHRLPALAGGFDRWVKDLAPARPSPEGQVGLTPG